MKLYTDQGNFQSIKILAAAEITGQKLDIVETKHDERIVTYLSRSRLPVLEVTPGSFLFSVNAAVSYLLQLGKNQPDDIRITEWLEWESAQLQPILIPVLISVVGHGKVDNTQIPAMQLLLKQLDTHLKGIEYIVGDQISAADISIWGSLYPLLTHGAAIPGWTELYANLSSWFTTLSEDSSIQSAVDQVTKGRDLVVFKESLLAQSVPPPPNISTKKTKSSEMSGGENVQSAVAVTGEDNQESEVSAAEMAAAVAAWNHGKDSSPKPNVRTHPILPKEGIRNILITSALPYVNNVPHLGNIIGCVLSADVFSRFCRLRNYNCLYICGTDEYGTATERKAVQEGMTPQQVCDKYNVLHREIYDWFKIDFDYFGRTCTEQQTEIAQDIFWKLYKNGYILKMSMEQLLCTKCDRFLADRFVEGICPFCAYNEARGDQCDKCGKLINAVELKQPKCNVCKSSPIIKSSDHLFLDLPKLEPLLGPHLDKVFKTGTWSSNAKMITNSWRRDGLKPRCISRDLKWGTAVPLEGYTDKVFYVWYDAPIGYISIMANYTEHWKKWWKNPNQVELYNFLGKDNVPFHSVIFPCTLLGADDNYTIVSHLLATEYLNYEDGKFSKSRGIGVFGNDAKDTGIPADIYRFYILFMRPETQDSVFCWDDFLLKNNSELLNNLGNFINRGLMFVENNFGGIIQEMTLTEEDNRLLAQINRELHAYIENMDAAKIRDSLRIILNISRLGNQFMQINKPWVLVKGNGMERSRAGTIVSLACNISNLLSVLLQPYMPDTSQTIQIQLNSPAECNHIYKDFVCHLPAGHKIGKPSPLFEKISAETIGELKKKFAGSQEERLQKVEKKKAAPAKMPAKDNSPASNPEEAQRLTDAVTKQGLVVRELKASKADKSDIDREVAKLLDLKKQLAAAQGQSPTATSGGGKKKGKKK